MRSLRDVDLTRLNSFGVAARAREVFVLETPDDGAMLQAALVGRPPPLIVGGGSNLLFAGDPAMPLVLVRTLGRRVVEDDGEQVVIEIEAGENWDEIVRWSLLQGFCGLENLALIPGSVGAAPWQNIGAYGVEVADHIDSVEAFSPASGAAVRLARTDCGFGYRDSVFKHGAYAGWLIRSVRLALSRRPCLRLDYADLRAEPELPPAPTACDVADAVTRIRRRKLPDPAHVGNAGSFFKNPVLEASFAEQLRAAHPRLPLHPVAGSPQTSKASAAWLIDACGWKGFRDGPIGVSDAHALVLVNHGGGSGAALLALATRIQQSVHERFGVMLEPEPTIVG